MVSFTRVKGKDFPVSTTSITQVSDCSDPPLWYYRVDTASAGLELSGSSLPHSV